MSLTIVIHEWVTGGGLAGSPLPESWAKEGAAMRRALAHDFLAIPGIPTRVLMTLDRRLPHEDGPWEVLRVDEGREQEVVCSAASQSDFTLVIAPETDGILQQWALELERLKIPSLGSSPEAVAIAGNKIRFHERLIERGIATPQSRVVDPQELPIDAEYPAVLKPIDGAGSVSTYLVDSPDSSPPVEERMAGWLLQTYIPGEAMSASYLVDEAGEPHLIGSGKQNIRIQGNRLEYCGGELSVIDQIDDRPLRLAIQAIPGLLGFTGVDFVWDQQRGEATVIEINPRPTTSCVGQCKILNPGRLAEAWLVSCGLKSNRGKGIFEQLAQEFMARGGIAFNPDGSFRP